MYNMKIYRFNPDVDKQPYMQDVSVKKENVSGIMLLDLLKAAKEQDASLSFRHACGAGVCGSDGMNINGKNGLACMTQLNNLGDNITLRPMPGLPVIRDLIVDLDQFYKQFHSIKPFLQAKAPANGLEHIQSEQDRQKMDGLYECILCACCTTSCPSWWWNPDKFVGPAGLLWACRFIVDTRDQKQEERLADLEGLYRLFRCRGIMNCAVVCPKGLNPTKAIATIHKTMINAKLSGGSNVQ